MTDIQNRPTYFKNDRPDPLECFFYTEAEAAERLGVHRTTLRHLALEGRSPVEAIQITEHRRIYRRVDIHRLAGLEP
jgi:excisionase family DNA binding protein